VHGNNLSVKADCAAYCTVQTLTVDMQPLSFKSKVPQVDY